MTPTDRRILILAEGELGAFSSKTAACLCRYVPAEVVAVLDSTRAGRTAGEVLGLECDAPVVATLDEALVHRPTVLIPGIAPQGAVLPEAWRPVLRAALVAGVDVVSGLHLFLSDDPELMAIADASGALITDLRRPPVEQPIARGRATGTRALRILTVGTDCNVGKMCAAWELARAGTAAGLDSRFVATGQTGMMLAGDGVTLDRVPGDFMAGMVERQVLAEGEADLVIVEGQGAILHPAYSPVTLALLHGALPDAMVLVHHLGRDEIRHTGLTMPPISTWVRLYEDLLAPIYPGRVAAIAANPHGLAREEAEEAMLSLEEETGLPVRDAVAGGAPDLLESALRTAREVRASL